MNATPRIIVAAMLALTPVLPLQARGHVSRAAQHGHPINAWHVRHHHLR